MIDLNFKTLTDRSLAGELGPLIEAKVNAIVPGSMPLAEKLSTLNRTFTREQKNASRGFVKHRNALLHNNTAEAGYSRDNFIADFETLDAALTQIITERRLNFVFEPYISSLNDRQRRILNNVDLSWEILSYIESVSSPFVKGYLVHAKIDHLIGKFQEATNELYNFQEKNKFEQLIEYAGRLKSNNPYSLKYSEIDTALHNKELAKKTKFIYQKKKISFFEFLIVYILIVYGLGRAFLKNFNAISEYSKIHLGIFYGFFPIIGLGVVVLLPMIITAFIVLLIKEIPNTITKANINAKVNELVGKAKDVENIYPQIFADLANVDRLMRTSTFLME